MSFFKSIKRAFGFGDDAEIEAYDPEVPLIPASDEVEAPESAGKLEIDSEHTDLIFQHVVSIFNQALPAFLADSVDCDKQRKILYDSLDQSLKDYLKSLQKMATQQCQADWMAERDKLQANADELKKHADELEERRANLKDKQLSAERQKRALSERVRDLEAQVLRLESEKEQLDIENKCMINKAKAAAVLEAELEELRGNSDPAEALRNEVNDAMLSDFKRQAAEATQKVKEQEERLANIDETLSLKDAQIDDLKQAIAQKEAALAQSLEDLAARDAKIAENEVTINKREAELAEKEEAIKEKDTELAEKEEALSNSISAEELEAIQGQISQFEEVKLKMDSHIEKLREALRKSQEENRALNDALKKRLKEKTKEKVTVDIPDIVSEPSVAYKPTTKDDSTPKEEPAPKVETAPKPQPTPLPEQQPKALEEQAPKKETKPREETRQKSKRNYINDLDDVDAIISGSNWMVSMPEEESPMGSKSEKTSFGYQTPQRKHISDNNPQPSLFDF